jgi:propionyl-CoA carboxylase alpha chain
VEKFIVNPRHIEIQVLGDKHGHVIWLGERECSIQRRNQKVIEEAPSPLLDEKTRRAMGEQAVALAKAVGYDSAGTVEFVVGQDSSFYFLEMNTRLQVEHPVTELVTGIDLVEEMIRVAAGDRLSLAQDDVKRKGWAIESRVYAEDPTRRFLPSVGRLVRYAPPIEGNRDGVTVRNDTGVYEGGEISVYFDPMIAKLVTHAGDRAAAIEAQSSALDAFYIEGIRHNIPFLSALMRHPRWREGRLSTGFIAEEFPTGFTACAPDGPTERVIAAVAAHVDHVMNTRKRGISGQLRAPSRLSFDLHRIVAFDERRIQVTIAAANDGIRLTFDDGERLHVNSSWAPGIAVWRGDIDDTPVSAKLRAILNGFEIAHGGAEVVARVFTAKEAELAGLMLGHKDTENLKVLKCPMPGLVKSIVVSEGQDVKAGESLCVVEAMKMENVLLAERDVSIKKILAKPGDSLAVDAIIIEFG